ncbi:MAG: flagellar M-ring protein FliF, partial [Treponema sp.]|nr:flagellar M-ring protein FliF [Treponema sp.]
VEGLSEDNITIVNGESGEEINDFEGMEESDRISLVAKQEKELRKLESEYSSKALKALQATYGDKRVKVTNMTIEMDMSQETYTAVKHSGITIKEDNPDTVYDDSETVHSLVISEETVDKKFTGTGYNPEGPAGVEGQNPPVYSDMSSVIGESTENGVKRNFAVDVKNITGTKSPEKGRRTISVNIDGVWNYPLYDDNGKLKLSKTGGYEREYVPISDAEKEEVIKLLKDAIGFDAQRKDSVTVTNIPFDRTDQFREEDAAYIKAQQTKKMIFFVLLGIAVVLIIFIAFRLISREIERRRRLREEELLRRQQAEREQAIWDAKNEDISVTMSVEERRRAELQENAIAMAKEHPEDVAMLIRTWLREEA